MTPADLQSQYDEAGYKNTPYVLRAASLIYAVIAVAHWVVLPPASRLVMTLLASSTSVLLAFMAVRLPRWHLHVGSKHLLGLAALLFILNVFVHLILEPAAHQATNVMLLILLFGALLFDVRWVCVLIGIAVGGWFVIAQPWSFPAPLGMHYSYSVLISTAAAAIIFRARQSLLHRSIELQDAVYSRARELEFVLEEVHREQEVNIQLSAILTDLTIILDATMTVTQYRMPDGTDFLARHCVDQPSTWRALQERILELGADRQRMERLQGLIELAWHAGQSGAVEIWVQPMDSPRHIYEIRVLPLSQSQLMLVFRDVSEMILAQEALIREDAARLKAADLEREIAQRRKAEDELAESLALIRATLETTVDGLLVIDTFGNVRQYNGRFRSQWSLPDGLEMWRLQSVVHTVLRKALGTNPELVQAIFHPDALQSGETFHTVVTTDHREFELYSRVQELAGRTLGRVWTFREVTERTRTLQALRQSEANLHALFASSIQAFVLLDQSGIILTSNPTAGEYGYKYLNLSIQNGLNLLEAINQDAFRNWFSQALAGGIVVREQHYQGHDFDFTMVPVYDSDRVVGVSLSVVNTDDRVAALSALRASEESLRLAVEAGGLILWFYEWASARLVWQAGRQGPVVDLLADLADAPLRGLDVVYEDDKLAVAKAFQAIATHSHGVDVEFRVRLADRLAWVHVRGEPILDTRGTVLRVIGVAEDITDRREFQQRLEQARDRAEEANRLKNSILTNMSHEIRTPMTSILGFSEILVRRLEDPTLKQSAMTIQRGGKRLLFLLDNLIDLAKLEVNRLDLRATQHPARDSVRAVVALYADQIAQKGVALELDDRVEQTVYTDARREQQVLAAVLDNAVRFTASGSIQVSLTFETRAGTDYVGVVVADTGSGISVEFLPHIFEDFRQESEGLSRSHEGSGLGLSLAKRLLDQMGGEIAIESVKGQGTRVCILLPHQGGASSGVNAAAVALHPGVTEDRTGVLIVGDTGFRHATRDAIEAAHPAVRVAEVNDLSNTAAILESARVASVVIQVEGGHLEPAQRAINALRQIPSLQGAHKVAIVRAATPSILEHLQVLGFDRALAGPIDLTVAARIVSRITNA